MQLIDLSPLAYTTCILIRPACSTKITSSYLVLFVNLLYSVRNVINTAKQSGTLHVYHIISYVVNTVFNNSFLSISVCVYIHLFNNVLFNFYIEFSIHCFWTWNWNYVEYIYHIKKFITSSIYYLWIAMELTNYYYTYYFSSHSSFPNSTFHWWIWSNIG